MADKAPKFVFKKAEGNVIAWPCTISVPVEGGGRQDQELIAKFKVASQQQIEEFYSIDGLMKHGAKRDEKFLSEYLVGGVDVPKGEAGTASDEEVKALVLETSWAIDGVVRGYFDMIGRRLPKN